MEIQREAVYSQIPMFIYTEVALVKIRVYVGSPSDVCLLHEFGY